MSRSRGADPSRAETWRSMAGGPLDRHVGVVVRDAALDRLVVVGRALVHDVRRVGENDEPVREPDRAVELVEVLLVEAERLPLAEGGRAAAEVDDHVEDRAAAA